MRERIQRRKKTTTEKSNQPVPPPLQPAYFAAAAEGAPPQERDAEPVQLEAAEHEPAEVNEPVASEESAPSAEVRQPSSRSATRSADDSQRGRPKRRRGGRGRGGRGREPGREKAVAAAFAPGKAVIPEVGSDTGGVAAVEEPVDLEAEAAEPQTEAAAASQSSEVQAPKTHAPKTPAVVPTAPARPPKGLVVLAIGLPGSGKSSWFKRNNLAPLSSDMVRSLLFDDVREQRFQDLVFSNLRSMLKARLIAKRPMNYVDATNLTPQERQHWIKLAKDYGYEVHAVFFDVPLEVCIERHQRRDRVVPEDVMRRMAAKLKPPSFDEGYAKITVVRVKKKE